MKFRGSMYLALCLVSVSACSSSDDPTPPVEDTSAGGDTAPDTVPPDTMVPDTATAEDTLSVDSNTPDSAMIDSAMVDSASDATDSMVDSAADTAAVDSGVDTTVSDSGSDTAAVADTGTDLGVDPCSAVPACPAAASGNVQFCGSVFDLADTSRVNGVTANVRVSVYDLLAYAMSPTSTAPIATFSVDSCGRFSSTVTSSVSRFLVAVDDASSTTDAYAMTGIPAVAKDTSGRYNGLRAFAMRKTTDAAWSTSAGLSPSLVTRGAYLGIFIDPYKLPVGPFSGAPVAGVQFTKSSIAIPASDYYLSDTAALSRTTVSSTASMTGVNGAGLLLDQSVADGVVISANGGLGEGCRWPMEAAASVPGLMLVQEFVMTSLPGWTCTGAP